MPAYAVQPAQSKKTFRCFAGLYLICLLNSIAAQGAPLPDGTGMAQGTAVTNTRKVHSDQDLLQMLSNATAAEFKLIADKYRSALLFSHRFNNRLADYYQKTGNWSLMAAHTVLSLEDGSRKYRRTVSMLTRALHHGNWHTVAGNAFSLLKETNRSGIPEDMLLRLAAYGSMKTGSWSNAFTAVRQLFVMRTNLSKKEAHLLFALAMTNNSGLEAVFWGNAFREQLQRKSDADDWRLLNNLSWAHYLASQEVSETNRTRYLRDGLSLINKAVKQNRSFELLDTKARILHALGLYREEQKLLILMRALQPGNRGLLTRIRAAQSAGKGAQ